MYLVFRLLYFNKICVGRNQSQVDDGLIGGRLLQCVGRVFIHGRNETL